MRLRNNRMKRDDGRDAAAHRMRGAAEGRRRNDADVTMRDVDALASQRIADRADTRGGYEKSKSRRARSGNPVNANAIDLVVSRRRCYDNDVMTGRRERGREVLKVALDPSDARMIPVTDEGNLQVDIDIESRPRCAMR